MAASAKNETGAGAGGADDMAVDSGAGSGEGSTTALLAAEVPKIVKAAAKQLKAKSTKTRIAAFHCLRQVRARLRASPAFPGLL